MEVRQWARQWTEEYLRGVAVNPAKRRPSLVSPLHSLPTPNALSTVSYMPPILTWCAWQGHDTNDNEKRAA